MRDLVPCKHQIYEISFRQRAALLPPNLQERIWENRARPYPAANIKSISFVLSARHIWESCARIPSASKFVRFCSDRPREKFAGTYLRKSCESPANIKFARLRSERAKIPGAYLKKLCENSLFWKKQILPYLRKFDIFLLQQTLNL